MTTIAILVAQGHVYMSADSAGTSGVGRRWYRTRPKIARLTAGERDVLVATAGPTSLNAFVYFHLKLDAAPNPSDDADCDRWAQAVADAITSWAAEAQPTVLGADGHLDGTVVLGYAGRVWNIHEHHADRIATPYLAVGSGGDLALGALAALHTQVAAGQMTPREATRLAVQIAARWDDGTAGDIHSETLPTPTPLSA